MCVWLACRYKDSIFVFYHNVLNDSKHLMNSHKVVGCFWNASCDVCWYNANKCKNSKNVLCVYPSICKTKCDWRCYYFFYSTFVYGYVLCGSVPITQQLNAFYSHHNVIFYKFTNLQNILQANIIKSIPCTICVTATLDTALLIPILFLNCFSQIERSKEANCRISCMLQRRTELAHLCIIQSNFEVAGN